MMSPLWLGIQSTLGVDVSEGAPVPPLFGGRAA